MTDKLTGYLLLLVGLGIIFFAGFSAYSVFTKKTEPVNLFNLTGISLDLSQAANIELPQEFADAGVKISDTDQKQEILSSELLNSTSNLVAHIILMGFIVNIGYKVAMLGVEMNRTVIVNVRNQERSVLVPPTTTSQKLA